MSSCKKEIKAVCVTSDLGVFRIALECVFWREGQVHVCVCVCLYEYECMGMQGLTGEREMCLVSGEINRSDEQRKKEMLYT